MTRRVAGRRVVVAGLDATPGERFDHLLLLVHRLVLAGLDVEVLLVAGGERLQRLRDVAPVTTVNGFGRRGPAGVATLLADLLGAPGRSRWLKSLRLRAWVARRDGAAWLVHDPVAAGLVRVGRARIPYLLACLPTVATMPADLRSADLATLRTADRWLVRTATQAAELRSVGVGDGDIVEIGSVRRPPSPGPVETARRSVVLVPTSPVWEHPNHTGEVARYLADRHSELRMQWVVDGADDRWLARYDVDRLHLAAVELVDSGSVDLADALVVVRTGYGDGSQGLSDWAGELGVPLLGFELESGWDRHAVVESVTPLDVDRLLERLTALVGPEESARTERRCRDRRAILEARIDLVGDLAEHLGTLSPVRRRRSRS